MRITENIVTNNKILETSILGIMLSGGMDSALLLFVVAKTFNNRIKPYTVPKTDGAAHYVNPIISWINTRLDRNIPQTTFIGNPYLHHSAIINHAIPDIESQCDFLYFGGNSYPEDILPNGPRRTRRTNPKHIQPFFDCYKTDILQAYVDLNLMDLLPLTHTCTEFEIGRCNNCWQCRERKWAFIQLDMIDNTTT